MTKWNNVVVVVITFTFFSFLSNYSVIAQDSLYSSPSVHYQTDEFNVSIFSENSVEIFPGKSRFTPSKEEINLAEKSLSTQLKELNSEKLNQSDSPVIDKNLRKYKRQYFGYIDKNGNKILFINCFWKREKEESLLWLKERIRVLDGGSYFWNVKFNITKNILFDLDVNGEV